MKNTRLTTTPPLTHALRVYIYNVPVFAGTTRTCVSTCARGAGIHEDVLDGHTTPRHNNTTTTPHGDRERETEKERQKRETREDETRQEGKRR